MPAKQARPLAILMGDLVASERARSLRAIHRAFNEAVDFANKHYAASIESPLTITLGDEFQGFTGTLSHAWAIASALRLRLLAADVSCRFVIGTADPDTAALLQVPLGAPTAHCRCAVIDNAGVAIYVADIIYRNDCVKLYIELLGPSKRKATAKTPANAEPNGKPPARKRKGKVRSRRALH